MKAAIIMCALLSRAGTVSAQQPAAPRVGASTIDITTTDVARITRAAAFFGRIASSGDSIDVVVRYDRSFGTWRIGEERVALDSPQDSIRLELRVAPDWTLVDSAVEDGPPRPYLRHRDGTRIPVRVVLSPVAQAELRRSWDIPREERLSPFSRSIDAWAQRGDYVWIALRGGMLENLNHERCEGGTGDACTDHFGAVMQLNTRTRAVRYLLPIEVRGARVQRMFVTERHLWIATFDDITRYRIIPDTGVRPAPIGNTPRGSVRHLATDGRTVALVTSNGLGVAEGDASAWNSRWFAFDDAADVTSYWLATEPGADSVLAADTIGAASYGARRGVRILMDVLRMPVARRPAFRAAAGLLPASRYVEVYKSEGDDDGSPGFRDETVVSDPARALTHPTFLPFLIEALSTPAAIDDSPGGHQIVAVAALMGLPNDAERRVLHGVLDTLRDMRVGVLIADQMAQAGDSVAKRWLMARLADRDLLAREVAPAAPSTTTGIFSVVAQLHDTAFAPPLLALLPDTRFTAYVLGTLAGFGTEAPRVWHALVRRAAIDSSLAGYLLHHASQHPAPVDDAEGRVILHGLARRVLRLGTDTVVRKRFSLNIGSEVDLVTAAVSYVVRERDGTAVPDLLRLLREGNAWDAAAARFALVNLTGVDTAPAAPAWEDPAARRRVAIFWERWKARTPHPVVVSAEAGARAEARYRSQP